MRFDLCLLWQESNPASFLAEHGGKFRGLVTSAGVGADAELITSLPSLEVIASRGVGYDKIDLVTAQSRTIQVSNTPDILTDCVADLAFGALLAVVRRIPVADRFVRSGDWKLQRFPMATKVSGKRLGIVGMGRIGRSVAQRASGFDMEIRYHSRTAKQDLPYAFVNSLRDLAQWSDFLIISTLGGEQTKHLVSADILTALGPAGYLINVARGTVVDQSALVEMLVDGRIAGAALDVFEDEPNVPEVLLGLDSVVLLPHIASSTHETFTAMESLVLKNLQSYFERGYLVTPVV